MKQKAIILAMTSLITFVLNLTGCANNSKKQITIGSCTIEIKTINAKLDNNFVKGFDASACLDAGNVYAYRNKDGKKENIFTVLKEAGYNYVRLRIWNDPYNKNNPYFPGKSDKASVAIQCKQAKDAGLKVLLDFHYSDYWADPGKQTIPQEWLKNKNKDEMCQSIYDYTKEILNMLKEQDTNPDMIQIGNEINSGILTGYYNNAKEDKDIIKAADEISGSSKINTRNNFTEYLKSGIKAAREVCPQSKIMLHGAGGSNMEWLFDIFKEADLDYDIIGLSYYPFEASHGTIDNLGKSIKKYKALYNKDVIIAETAHPYKTDNNKCIELVTATKNLTCSNKKLYKDIEQKDGIVTATIQNQANVVRAVIQTCAKNEGSGVFEWGGEYIGAWKYGMFDKSGMPLPSLYVYQQ